MVNWPESCGCRCLVVAVAGADVIAVAIHKCISVLLRLAAAATATSDIQAPTLCGKFTIRDSPLLGSKSHYITAIELTTMALAVCLAKILSNAPIQNVACSQDVCFDLAPTYLCVRPFV